MRWPFIGQCLDLSGEARNGYRMSTEPVVAARAPAKVALEAGKDYWFCTCGRSATQPFCSGSHKGTGFAPKKFTAEKSGDAWLCQCKHSGKQPYCDGSHKSLAT
jgi:CDGSH-type Zn-finger protein